MCGGPDLGPDLVAAGRSGHRGGRPGLPVLRREKQCVALARLLLKAPSVVVLDEATAHLDSESEAVIQQALKTALAGRTSLVIAHRLSTVREAYQILVIDEGRVVERGNHQRLIDAGGLYVCTGLSSLRPQGLVTLYAGCSLFVTGDLARMICAGKCQACLPAAARCDSGQRGRRRA